MSDAKIKTISYADIRACPHLIMVPEHYRDDGRCRCDDETATEMAGWGYVWRDGEWRSGPEDDGQ